MEVVWDGRSSIQQATLYNKHNSSSNYVALCKKGCRITVDNCGDKSCFLKDLSVLACKQHCTGVVNLDTHLLQHHNTDVAKLIADTSIMPNVTTTRKRKLMSE
jgi:hypothetical protein